MTINRQLRRVAATRYVLPLREGGSLPALIEADDQRLYVLKFHGAAQGPRALVAEVIGAAVVAALGLPVPEVVLVDVEAALGKAEPNPEINELITRSEGLNLGMAYLQGSVMYDPGASPAPDPLLASSIVWADAYLSNVDRTARNTNMLLWQHGLWLIDHGAGLYWHHDWNPARDRSADPFPLIRDHVLLSRADAIAEADAALAARLTDERLEAAVAALPDAWLTGQPPWDTPDAHRAGYLEYLRRRRDARAAFVQEAVNARARRL